MNKGIEGLARVRNMQADTAKAKLKQQLVGSKIIKREHIRNQPMDAATRAVFRSLHLSASVQREAGIFADLALASSDDDDDNDAEEADG